MLNKPSMKIRAYLERKQTPCPTIEPDQPLRMATLVMLERQAGALAVLDANGQLRGIISGKDLLRASIQASDLHNRPVSEFMTREVVIGNPEQTLTQAMAQMARAQVHHLPIVEAGEVLSVVSLLELVEEAHTEDEQELQWMHEYVYGVTPTPASVEV